MSLFGAKISESADGYESLSGQEMSKANVTDLQSLECIETFIPAKILTKVRVRFRNTRNDNDSCQSSP